MLGVLVNAGGRNAAFDSLLDPLPETAGEELPVHEPVDPTDLLPHSPRVYRNAGSVTTPPSTEGIRWLVLERPITVSEHQLDVLSDVVEGNARPVQPRSSRSLSVF